MLAHQIKGEPAQSKLPEGTAERLSLEDELDQQLRTTRVVLLIRSYHLSKLSRARVNRNGGAARVEQRVIESIDEFHTKLDLHAFSQMDVFAQTQVDVVDWI